MSSINDKICSIVKSIIDEPISIKIGSLKSCSINYDCYDKNSTINDIPVCVVNNKYYLVCNFVNSINIIK